VRRAARRALAAGPRVRAQALPLARGAHPHLDHAEKLFAEMYSQDGVRLPGDRRVAARGRTPTEGVRIPKALYDTIQELAAG
ncbi:MAG: hypothetical protein AAF441_26510, partial [Pseudomonadota bacterium]